MRSGRRTFGHSLPRIASLAFALLGCGEHSPRTLLTSNQPPVVTLARPTHGSNGEIAFRWSGRDVDGKIDHYVFAVDPKSVDRVDAQWSATPALTTSVRFARSVAIGRAAAVPATAEAAHVFAVRAVDDRGDLSNPATMTVFGDSLGIGPSVTITSPQPNPFFSAVVPSTFTIHWAGEEQDARIVEYKYRLFTQNNPDFPGIPDFIDYVMANPGFITTAYAPEFASWDSVGANVTEVTYSGLLENEPYLFAITAIDKDGHYDAVFSASKNLLKFFVSESVGKMLLCVSSSIFNFCSSTGTDFDLAYDLPAGMTIPVSWLGILQPGVRLTGFRWAIDPSDTTGTLSREHDNADPNHWTAWDLGNISATVGPYPAGDAGNVHTLYIQGRDEVGRVTTARVHFTVVGSTPTRELLVVDDTRLTLDQIQPGVIPPTLAPPSGTWPSAAELDTFLFARGGFAWQGYPAGTLSPPGILAGYDFDTLGTRALQTGVVPYSRLAQYRQVIWLTDETGATYTGSPAEHLQPTTSLRYMSSPGQVNTLAQYAAAGGKLWLSGGGAAYATLVYWGVRNTPFNTWSHANGELVAGRFMYDFPHWRSEVTSVNRGTQALFNSPVSGDPTSAPGRGWPGQPDYTKLEVAAPVLRGRTCATDPPPPLRICNSFYLVSSFQAEYLSQPNAILEDTDPRPNHEALQSTLDSLYVVTGGTSTPGTPIMTYYHGSEGGPVVFSGFPVWFFQRAQCQALVDFVLQDIWGLSRSSPPAATATFRTRR
jgi:hypothetical protein